MESDFTTETNLWSNFTQLEVRESLAVFYIFWSSAALGGILNIMFLVCILSFRRFRRPANYPLVLISLGSLGNIITTTIYTYSRYKRETWYNIPYICQITGGTRRIPQPIMSLSTVMVILCRRQFAKNPLARPNSWIFIKRLLLITLFSIAVSIPQSFSRIHDPTSRKVDKCSKILLGGSEVLTILYQIVFLLSAHVCPSSFLIKELWVSRSLLKQLFSSRERPLILRDKKAQLSLTSCAFTIVYLICWPQMGFYYFMNNLPPRMLSTSFKTFLQEIWKYSRTLSFAYTTANPTLLIILCYDWKLTTFVSLITERETQHDRRISSSSTSFNRRESTRLSVCTRV